MRGLLRDKVPTPKRSWLSVPEVGPSTRMYGVLGLVVLTMTTAAAGVLSGLGLFLLAMLAMEEVSVVFTSLLLSFSTATFLLCYGWLTA